MRIGLLSLLLALPLAAAQPKGYTIPTIDISGETHRQVIVDREPGQYLGHPSTLLLPDNRTMLIAYPKGHGKGSIVYKKSYDGGLTWTQRLPTPANWSASMEVPTLFRLHDPTGKPRILMFSGKAAGIRVAYSEDDGESWSPLKTAPNAGPAYGGIVAMSSMIERGDGSYMAFFHDDGRWLRNPPVHPEGKHFEVYKVISRDGGLTWSQPEIIAKHSLAHLCEPGAVRSPDGKQIAVLLRENSRRLNSFVVFFRRRRRDLERTARTARCAYRRPSHGKIRAGRPPLHHLPRPRARQPDARRLGRLGRPLRRPARRARRAIPGPPARQPRPRRHRLPRPGTFTGRHIRGHDLRPLDTRRGALHRQYALQAGRVGPTRQASRHAHSGSLLRRSVGPQETGPRRSASCAGPRASRGAAFPAQRSVPGGGRPQRLGAGRPLAAAHAQPAAADAARHRLHPRLRRVAGLQPVAFRAAARQALIDDGHLRQQLRLESPRRPTR